MSVDDIVQSITDKSNSDNGIDRILFIEQNAVLTQIANTVYSVLTTVILLFVPIIISIELIYICFPITRDKFDRLIIKVEGNGAARKAVGLVLGDAKHAVEEACTVTTGRSALYIYLTHKIKSLMFIMFILCLIINGATDLIWFVWTLIREAVFEIWK